MKSTLVFTFFHTLTLAHLERSLFSLARQTLLPDKLLFFDNNSPFSPEAIERVISQQFNINQWALYYAKHANPMRQYSWRNNAAIRFSETDVFIVASADYIYDFDFCKKLLSAYADEPMSYAAAWTWQMNYANGIDPDVDLESFNWRSNPKNLMSNISGSRMERAVHIDGPCFCSSKQAMDAAGWYDEELAQWGFNQQDLQAQMVRKGVKMKVVSECLHFHMQHSGERDMERAKQEWAHSSRRVPDILAEEQRLKMAEDQTEAGLLAGALI